MALTLTPEIESRVLAEASRRNQAPDAVIDAALKALLRDDPVQDEAAQEADESEEDRQKRLHALMNDLLAKAHEIVPEPYDSPSRTYYRESEFGKILAEKFRKQGFNV